MKLNSTNKLACHIRWIQLSDPKYQLVDTTTIRLNLSTDTNWFGNSHMTDTSTVAPRVCHLCELPFSTIRLTITFNATCTVIFHTYTLFPTYILPCVAYDPSFKEPIFLYLHAAHQSYLLVTTSVPLNIPPIFDHTYVLLQGPVCTSHGLHQIAISKAKYIIICFFIILHNIPLLPSYTSLDTELMH